MELVYFKQASAIFALEDRYARDRGLRGPHPGPIGELELMLTGRVVNGVLEPYDEPRKLILTRNPSGYFSFFDRFTIGGRRFEDRPQPGTYRLRVESTFYQVHEQDISLPNPDSAIGIDLEPGYAYPFAPGEAVGRGGATLLRGTVYTIDAQGFRDLGVEVPGRSNRYRTDDTGQWVLVFPDTDAGGQVTVRFNWPNGVVEDVPAVDVVRGRSSNLFQAGLRGQVLSDAGVGLPGVRITVSGHIGASVSRDNGVWFYYFGLNQGAATVNVTAQLPDGATRTRFGVAVQPRAVVVVPTFRFN